MCDCDLLMLHCITGYSKNIQLEEIRTHTHTQRERERERERETELATLLNG